jgi:hypothetical protein
MVTDKITVPWMDKIRARLEERTKYNLEEFPESNHKYNEWHVIRDFIQPILDYGEGVEKKINTAYDRNTKLWERIRRKRR